MKVIIQKDNPLVSVIIPAYNAEKYILCALKSLDNQTYSNIESIIVDDGSTDKTLKLSKSYHSKKTNVKVIHQKNSGVSVARNTGMKHANGKYLMFLDADDELPSYSIEHLYSLIKDNKASIAIGKLQESKDFLEIPTDNLLSKSTIWKGTDAIKASMSDHPAGYSACGKLFDTEILKGIDFPVGRSFHEDNYFCFQTFLKQPTIVLTDNVVYFYRKNQGSSSYRAFSDKHLDILSVANIKRELVEKTFPELRKYTSNMILKSRLCFLMNLARSKTHQYNSYMDDCVKEVKKRRKDFIPVGFRNKIECFIITSGLYPLYKIILSSICSRNKVKAKN